MLFPCVKILFLCKSSTGISLILDSIFYLEPCSSQSPELGSFSRYEPGVKNCSHSLARNRFSGSLLFCPEIPFSELFSKKRIYKFQQLSFFLNL